MTQNDNVTVYLERQIQNASSVEQVVMMYDGAIRFYTKARYCMEQNDVEGRFNNASRAGNIMAYLLDILDLEKGGEVGIRLAKIYGHILKRHLDIDMKNDITAVDEIIGHLKTLRSSWEKVSKGETGEDSEGKSDQNGGAAPKSAIA